jgi:sporulation protein YabP
MVNRKEPEPKGFHNLVLENRNILSLTGVTDVDNFDERSITLYTQLGELVIQGKDLRINSMSVETGDLSVEGDIWSLVYGDKDRKKSPTFFSKLFR